MKKLLVTILSGKSCEVTRPRVAFSGLARPGSLTVLVPSCLSGEELICEFIKVEARCDWRSPSRRTSSRKFLSSMKC